MKNVIMILIVLLFSCKTGKHARTDNIEKEVLLYYSKGPCMGKCPVYNLWVFVDGTVLYREVFMAKEKKTISGKLSTEEMWNLTNLLKNSLGYPTPFRRIRDRPVTILQFDGKEFEYHASKIKDPLKEANDGIEALVKSLKADERER
ncbi:DUF6438 domain-containing protein [Maribacter sp. 2210JD10-5]|uniref:DUF6438 domain-containing protein n=1 Tax=Maribacter sp. 2210JD10-5 TaxID=3386272 RepID=UPI0039BD5CC1